VGIAGGMPTLAIDTYNGSFHQLQIPAVQAGGQVRTNVVITLGSVKSVAGIYSNVAEPFLYSFSGDFGLPSSTDGALPQSAVIQGSDGNFYGVTAQGGANNVGSVIKITPAGVESVLYSFSGGGVVSGSEDGAYPEAALVEGTDGNFYGTTYGGGTYELGTVFKFTTNTGVESVLHSFSGRGGIAGVNDGAEPRSALIRGSNGNFYGTTIQGGATGQNPVGGGSGTVFEINMAGDESIFYSFTGGVGSHDGLAPYAALLLGSDGNFYGTTWMGGAFGLGTVFRLTAGGAETVLYSFCAGGIEDGCADGSSPQSAMIQGSDGNYYGTARSGGAYRAGDIFKVTPDGDLSVLYSFSGDGEIPGSTDGDDPVSGLIEGSDGNLYGTTNLGGTYSRGAVYRISLAGEETVLHSFGGADNGLSGNGDGAQPLASLLQGRDGNFYGTTEQGGAHSVGSIFMLTNVVPAR
jgi:uncharacterized repeat protein (TIGR03803 family)